MSERGLKVAVGVGVMTVCGKIAVLTSVAGCSSISGTTGVSLIICTFTYI